MDDVGLDTREDYLSEPRRSALMGEFPLESYGMMIYDADGTKLVKSYKEMRAEEIDRLCEDMAIDVLKISWGHLFVNNKLIYRRPSPVMFWRQVDMFVTGVKEGARTFAYSRLSGEIVHTRCYGCYAELTLYEEHSLYCDICKKKEDVLNESIQAKVSGEGEASSRTIL